MPIHKLTRLLTVLSQAPSAAEADDELNRMSLEQIAHQMDQGDLVGIMTTAFDAVTLTKAEAEAELKAMGSDGSFFEMFDDPAPHLVHAIIQFTINGTFTPSQALEQATTRLEDYVERSDLIGSGHIGRIGSINNSTWRGVALVLFRSLGTSEDIKAIAEAQINADIEQEQWIDAASTTQITEDGGTNG